MSDDGVMANMLPGMDTAGYVARDFIGITTYIGRTCCPRPLEGPCRQVYIVMAYVVMVYKVMAQDSSNGHAGRYTYMVMAYAVMAFIVMTYVVWPIYLWPIQLWPLLHT